MKRFFQTCIFLSLLAGIMISCSSKWEGSANLNFNGQNLNLPLTGSFESQGFLKINNYYRIKFGETGDLEIDVDDVSFGNHCKNIFYVNNIRFYYFTEYYSTFTNDTCINLLNVKDDEITGSFSGTMNLFLTNTTNYISGYFSITKF